MVHEIAGAAGAGAAAAAGPDGAIRIEVPTGESMRELGVRVAARVRGGDVLLLSGPLGAGKTTFAQGFGRGLGIGEPIVSPTFTIARELSGRFADGTPAHLVHVDAYRLGGSAYAPGQDTVGRLLDELESLGLDEELEDPGERTVILMEWGEQMVEALAPERLEIHIERPLDVDGQAGVAGAGAGAAVAGTGAAVSEAGAAGAEVGVRGAAVVGANGVVSEAGVSGAASGAALSEGAELTGDGMRVVTLVPVGPRWRGFAL